MHQERRRRRDKPVKEYVRMEWTLTTGPRVQGGVSRPHLGTSGHFGASLCIFTSEDVFLHLCFLVMCPWGRRPVLKNVLCGPNLTCSCVWPWTSLWHVHYYAKVSSGGRPTPPPHTHLAQCVLDHKNRENIKCRGSAGGNTPIEPKSLIYSTKVSHKLHQVGEVVSLSMPTFMDLTAKTHSNPLRDLQYLW